MNRRTLRLLAPWLLGSVSAVVAGCSGSGGEGDVGSTSSAITSSNNETAFVFFVQKGLSKDQAAGIVGNLDQESSMSPTVSQYGGGPGRGIAQWSAGGRWDHDDKDNVLWYASIKGQSPYSLDLQLDFIWYELTTFSSYGLEVLRNSTNITEATIAFERSFEGCGECDEANRLDYAAAAYSAYANDVKSTGTGANSFSTTRIAELALDNVGKMACSKNSAGGQDFDSSCTGNGGQPEYWCADFARWVWGEAGVDTSGLTAGAGSFYVYGQEHGTLHSTPAVGDAVVFNYQGGGYADHVAIVTYVYGNGTIETVSGDWGGDNGSEAEFASTSHVVNNAPAYDSKEGQAPKEMGMTISGYIAPVGGTSGGSGGSSGSSGGGSTDCYSETLGREMPEHACVQSILDNDWYECEGGDWSSRSDDKNACNGTYPLEAAGKGGCYSDTLGREMPDDACVQSKYDSDWYECHNGDWTDRWTDANACDGVFPL
jgi:hypothetical protein